MFRTTCVGRDERQIDVSSLLRRQFLFGLLRSFTQTLQGHWVLTQIDALFLLEFGRDVVNEHFVEIVTTKVSVTVRAENFDQFITDFKDRNVERTTTEVEDADLLFFFLIESISQSCGGWLVDNSSDFKTSNLTGVFCRLTLSVVEIGRYGDDGLVDFMTEIVFCGFLQLTQNQRGNFRRRMILAVDIDLHVVRQRPYDFVGHHLLFGLDFFVTTAHESFDRIDRILRVRDRLTFRWLTHKGFTLRGKRDYAGRRSAAFLIGDDSWFTAFHDRHHGVRCSQVNTDDFFARDCHDDAPLRLLSAVARSGIAATAFC